MKYRGEQPWRVNRARALRSTETLAERVVWCELRGRRLKGYKFLRQQPLGRYYVDFVCREHKLVLEVDGATHSGAVAIEYDNRRDRALEALGFRVLRMTNTDVIENLDGVLELIVASLEKRSP